MPRSAPPAARSTTGVDHRRRQKASAVTEAAFRAEDPAIIGLISMLSGTIDIEDIKKTYQRLWLTGKQILSGNSQLTLPKA